MARGIYGKRGYNLRYRGRKAYNQGSKILGLSLSPALLAGVALGFTNLDEKLPQELVLAAAVAPIRTGKIGAAARGIVLGNLIQKVTGGTSLGGHAANWGI